MYIIYGWRRWPHHAIHFQSLQTQKEVHEHNATQHSTTQHYLRQLTLQRSMSCLRWDLNHDFLLLSQTDYSVVMGPIRASGLAIPIISCHYFRVISLMYMQRLMSVQKALTTVTTSAPTLWARLSAAVSSTLPLTLSRGLVSRNAMARTPP